MGKTIRLTVAQALVKFLNNQYIAFDDRENRMFKGIFTIFGHGNVIGLGQALEEDPGELIVHQGRNEQGMAHAAMGFAKQKMRKQIYACTSSVGPGAANMVTAAATATAIVYRCSSCRAMSTLRVNQIRYCNKWSSRRICLLVQMMHLRLSVNIGIGLHGRKFLCQPV